MCSTNEVKGIERLRAERYELLGTAITAATFDEVVEAVLTSTRCADVHFVTVHTLVEARSDATLRDLLNAADIVAPDGMPLVWWGRLLRRHVQRVYGPDTMLAVLDRGRANHAKHFFYGGEPGVPELLSKALTARFPGLNVVGTYSPPFRPLSEDEDDSIVAMINEAHPDFVWVGLGSPKQDRWVSDHRDRIQARALLAVGAAFDYHTGRISEPPEWVKRSGLQWLHRLFQEPGRLWRRYTVVNAKFFIFFAGEITGRTANWLRGRLRRR